LTYQDERFRTLAYGGFDTQDTVFYLYDIATQIKAKKMVEIGVGHWGCSTRALLFAARDLDAHLWSVDIDPCLEARRIIKDWGLSEYWTFVQQDSREFLSAWSQGSVDLIHIDSGHAYDLTLAELRLSSRILSDEPKPLIAPQLPRPNGVILLHDTLAPNFPGVIRAVEDFLKKEEQNKYVYRELGTRYGLGMVMKI
jgi:peptidoglycan/xylan/chitin deacetylase (PgdA/CDA1 family)